MYLCTYILMILAGQLLHSYMHFDCVMLDLQSYKIVFVFFMIYFFVFVYLFIDVIFLLIQKRTMYH